MSLKSVLGKIVGFIAKLFGAMPAEIKRAVHTGVVVVENLKTAIDSPFADILTALIPGGIDDLVKDKIRQALPVFLVELKLFEGTLNLSDPEAICQAAIKYISQLDPVIKPGVLHRLAILIAQVAADGKLSWSDAVYVLEYYYKNEYQPLAA